MVRFTLPRDLYHGKGSLEALKTLEGKKAIICVGGGSMKRNGFLQKAEDYLKEAGMEVKLFEGIESDPSVETVMKGAAVMTEFEPDWIVAIGGGSPIDAAKAMWIKYEYPDTTFEDMCKVFGLPKLRKKAHFCAVSSTSGTATEVTAFSIITDYEKGIKYPIADFEITPDVAIVDPELAETMPVKLVAHTGMDALTHCIEAYTNKFAHPIVDMYALQGIKLIANNIFKAVTDGNNVESREAMALGSMYGGLCLGPVNTAAVHALSYPLGGEFHISHGLSNAILLPSVMKFNYTANPKKYADIAIAFGAKRGTTDEETALNGVDYITNLSIKCGIPTSLTEIGIPQEAVSRMAKAAMKVQRLLKNNPREVTETDACDIYNNLYK
mgnify:CR=1 FL=1